MRRVVHVLAAVLLAAGWLVVGPAVPGYAVPQDCDETSDWVPRQTPWALQRLQPKRVWPITKGEGVTVAVIDTGIDASHPQLQGQIVDAKDFAGGPGSATEGCLFHGTFVAGIIAAKPVEGVGFYGVAPGAKLMALRQTSASQDSQTTGIAQAIRYAVNNGADVINISVVSGADDSDLEAAVGYAAANDVVVVAAAGNDNIKTGQAEECQVCYPAAYESVLAVGAVAPKDKPARVSHSGSYVDIAAPGVEIVSLGPTGSGGAGYAGGQQGTSFAAPYVAGVAALVRSHYPEMSAAEVVERIKVTADPPVQGEENPLTGVGVVNPHTAVTQVLPTTAPAAQPPVNAALPDPPEPPDHTARNVVITVTSVGMLTVLVVAVVAVSLPRGRRRRWQPGRWEPAPEDDKPVSSVPFPKS